MINVASKNRKAEAIAVGIFSVLAFFLVDHFVVLCESAYAFDFSGKVAIAEKLLFQSFLPWNRYFFFLGKSELAVPIATVVAAMIAGFYVSQVFKGNFRHGQEHGSARFATQKEIKAYACKEVPTNNVRLCKDFMLQAHGAPDYEHARNRNVLVIGGSGAGKTFGYLKPNLMQIPAMENAREGVTLEDMEKQARSFFVTDSKGTTSVDTGFLFAEHGYEPKIFNVVDFTQSLHFNPFKYIIDRVDCMSFATCLVENTTGSNDPNREDFWAKAEKLFFNFAGIFMITELPPEERNLVTFCKIVDLAMVSDAGEMSELDKIMHELEYGVRYSPNMVDASFKETSYWNFTETLKDSEPWSSTGKPQPNHPAVLAYKDFLSGAKETKQSILISVKTRLTPLRADKVQEMLRYDEMEIDKIGERKTIIYCVFDGQDPTYNFLIAIMTWLMLKQLFTRCATKYAYTNHGELPVGVDFLLDEAANFYIPDLEKTIAQCRSMNIGITLMLQSKAQLKNRYGDNAETIIDCCDSLVFLGGKSTETNKMLEEMIGQETVTTENSSQNSAQAGVNKSLAQHGRALMQAPEIAKMSKLECLVLVAGCNPWKGPKANPENLPLADYVNPGKKGSKFKHGFDFMAYRENRRYYDFEATLESDVEVSAMYEDGKNIVDYYVEIRNTSDAPAYNVNFSTEISVVCETNERARLAGKALPFPWLDNIESGPLFRLKESFSTRLKPYEADSADILETQDSLGTYKFSGVTIPAGEKVGVTLRFAFDRTRLTSMVGGSHAAACDFKFMFEPSVHAANADMALESRCDIVTVSTETIDAEVRKEDRNNWKKAA